MYSGTDYCNAFAETNHATLNNKNAISMLYS